MAMAWMIASFGGTKPCPLYTCSPGTSLDSRTRSRIVRVAALPEDANEGKKVSKRGKEEDVEELLKEIELKITPTARDYMRDLMVEKVRCWDIPRRREAKPSIEDQFYDTFEKVEPFLDEPSDAMKELVAMIDASPAFKLEMPKLPRYPRWVTEGLTLALLYGFFFLVAHVNAVLDVYYARKAFEKRLERAEKAKQYENTRINQLRRRVREMIKVGVQYVEYWLQNTLFWLQSKWIELINRFKGRFT